MKIHSPNNIAVLLHCHTSPEPHKRIDAPAVKEAIDGLLFAGAIEAAGDNRFVTTDKGKAWVQALCNVEEPMQVWVDSEGRRLE